MYLPSGLPWTLPVVLRVGRELAARLQAGDMVALCPPEQDPVGVLFVDDVFPIDPQREAREVFGTDSPAHPGVAAVLGAPEWCLGGPVRVWAAPDWPATALTPQESRAAFPQRGWQRVAAFQTRNPAHRAHEHLQKCVLEVVDGMLLHPLVKPTRSEDLPAPVRWRAYEILIHYYFPPERVLLAAFPGAMRYGGPREAVFHALVRRNFGCTHFVVGRDHAGVGSFYGPYDAQRLFNRFDPNVIGIEVLRFDAAFYCRRCGGMATLRSCPHGRAERVVLSGTEVRRRLRDGEMLPEEFARPEIANFLLRAG